MTIPPDQSEVVKALTWLAPGGNPSTGVTTHTYQTQKLMQYLVKTGKAKRYGDTFIVTEAGLQEARKLP